MFIVIAFIGFGLGAVVALWTLTLLLVLAAVGLGFVCFAVFFVVAAGYLLFADLMGKFLKELRGIRLPQAEASNALRVGAVVLVALASFALAAYFLTEARHV